MMFRFGPFNPNNMTARGATLLRCSLFLAVSVNNTQSIVCGGLEKHLPWPSRRRSCLPYRRCCLHPVSLWNILLSPFTPRPLPEPHTFIHGDRAGIHQRVYFVRKLLRRGVKTPSLIVRQVSTFGLAPVQRNLRMHNSDSIVLASVGYMM